MTNRRTAARPKRSKRTSKSALHLSPIVDALSDAYSLVWTASQVIAQRNYGPEQGVLHLGVEALERDCEQLEEAGQRLSRYQKANNTARSTSQTGEHT